jgi:hypothetical protein
VHPPFLFKPERASTLINNLPQPKKPAGSYCDKENQTICVGGSRKNPPTPYLISEHGTREINYALTFGVHCSESYEQLDTNVSLFDCQ